MTLKQRELSLKLADQLGIDKKTAYQAVVKTFSLISDEVAKGHEVSIENFGRFYHHTPAPRDYFDFGAGAMKPTTPKPRVAFKTRRHV